MFSKKLTNQWIKKTAKKLGLKVCYKKIKEGGNEDENKNLDAKTI